jgi:cytochrome c-type biogenesis protein CcmH
MSYKKSLGIALLASVWFALLLAGTVFAQQGDGQPVSDDEVNAVARQLYCPVCENIPLDVCPTQACAEWRELIRLKLSEGWTENQIKSYFAEQYGDRVLAAPPAHGINWLVYILPPLVIATGLFILFLAFKAWKQPEADGAQSLAPTTANSKGEEDSYITRLEEELKNR